MLFRVLMFEIKQGTLVQMFKQLLDVEGIEKSLTLLAKSSVCYHKINVTSFV